MSTSCKDRLLVAARKGDIAELQRDILANKPDLSDDDIREVLTEAIAEKQTAVVEYILNEFPDLKIFDDIIQIAASTGSIPVFSLLVAREKDRGPLGSYPARPGSTVAARAIERYGTPLSLACEWKAPIEFLRYLLDLGAEPSCDPITGKTPLEEAAGSYPDGYFEAIDLLLERGAPLEGSGVLGCAAAQGKEVLLQYLLEEKGAVPDRDARITRFGTQAQDHPLHRALWGGHIGVVKLLLKHGASTGARTSRGKTLKEVAADLESRGKARSEIMNLLAEMEKERAAVG